MRTLLDSTGNYVRPHRRSALVATELRQYYIKIADLSKTRLLNEGSLKIEVMGYIFFGKDITLVDIICMVLDW